VGKNIHWVDQRYGMLPKEMCFDLKSEELDVKITAVRDRDELTSDLPLWAN
jgi:hypothetical protein